MDNKTNLVAKKLMRESISETFKLLMQRSRVTLVEISKNTGISPGTLSRIMTGKEANPTINSLKPIADFFDVSMGQLLGEEPLSLDEALGHYVENKSFWTSVPVLEWKNVHEYLSNENMTKSLAKKVILSDKELGSKSFGLIVTNDDWTYFSQDTILIIDPSAEVGNRGYILVGKKGQTIPIMKQLLIDDEGRKFLKPMNTAFEITPFDETYEIIGVMKEARKDY